MRPVIKILTWYYWYSHITVLPTSLSASTVEPPVQGMANDHSKKQKKSGLAVLPAERFTSTQLCLTRGWRSCNPTGSGNLLSWQMTVRRQTSSALLDWASELSRPGVLSVINETNNSTAQWISRSSERIGIVECYYVRSTICMYECMYGVIPQAVWQADSRHWSLQSETNWWCGLVLSSVPALACCR